MMDNYILDGHKPVIEPDLHKWANWYETANRHVDCSTIGDIRVSTVFLGIDHSFCNSKKQLFETMTFGDKDEYCERCETWEEAEKMHKTACDLVKEDNKKRQGLYG